MLAPLPGPRVEVPPLSFDSYSALLKRCHNPCREPARAGATEIIATLINNRSFLSGVIMFNAGAKKKIAQGISPWWRFAYRVQHRLANWKISYGGYASPTIFLLLLIATLYLSPTLQDMLEDYYSSQHRVEGLSALMLGVGTALIGAAAIVTSLVLFAMQVNVERMPHGLFRRLSADPRILAAFAFAFLLAIGVATLSTLITHAKVAIALLTALWAIAFILFLFRYAYRRALTPTPRR